jgi:predicted dehydrogenase
MKALVLGAGRMGIRHCLGVLKVNDVQKLFIVDINEGALANAKEQLEGKRGEVQIVYYLWEDFIKTKENIDVAIIASTAGNRVETCKTLSDFNIKYFLIEKPLGQSIKQVEELINYFDKQSNSKAFVNLNTRLYTGYKKLKHDLQNLTQFAGPLTISINTGTVGISANGIHYIDLIKYLTDANSIEITSAEIDENVIPSGRGAAFADFGGYAVLDFINKDGNKVAKAHLILGSNSTALGPWEIVGMHGRILIDEFEQTRFNKYRKPDSELPVQRYAGDYLPIETEKFEIPYLNDLTQEWLEQLLKENYILPEIRETQEVHKTMFSWLNKGKKYKDEFPIT